MVSFIINKLPCSKIIETVSLFTLCLNENLRSAPKLKEAIAPFFEAKDEVSRHQELDLLAKGCKRAIAAGLRVNAGHGLTYWNVYPVASIPGMEELNIGHSIIARASLVGLERAVREMKQAMLGNL